MSQGQTRFVLEEAPMTTRESASQPRVYQGALVRADVNGMGGKQICSCIQLIFLTWQRRELTIDLKPLHLDH